MLFGGFTLNNQKIALCRVKTKSDGILLIKALANFVSYGETVLDLNDKVFSEFMFKNNEEDNKENNEEDGEIT